MSVSLNQSKVAGEEQASTAFNVDESLVTEMWRETKGRVSQAQIQLMVAEAKNEYADAIIMTYVPIFIRRQVRAKLSDLLKDGGTLHDPIPLHLAVEVEGESGEEASITAESDQKFVGWLLGFVS